MGLRVRSLKELHVVQPKENGKENEANLYRVEDRFQTEFRRISFFVQEQGNGVENTLHVEKDPNNGEPRHRGVQQVLVKHPADVGHAPCRHATSNKQPKRPAEASSPPNGKKTQCSREPTRANLQAIREERAARRGPQRQNDDSIESDNNERQDSKLPGHPKVLLHSAADGGCSHPV